MIRFFFLFLADRTRKNKKRLTSGSRAIRAISARPRSISASSDSSIRPDGPGRCSSGVEVSNGRSKVTFMVSKVKKHGPEFINAECLALFSMPYLFSFMRLLMFYFASEGRIEIVRIYILLESYWESTRDTHTRKKKEDMCGAPTPFFVAPFFMCV